MSLLKFIPLRETLLKHTTKSKMKKYLVKQDR